MTFPQFFIRGRVAHSLPVSGSTHAAWVEIIEAANADKALSLLNAGLSFDLLLTDIRMPGTLDGFELAQLVRAKYPSVKVILCSAHIPLPAWNEVADAICAKPYDLSELVRTIFRLLV